MKDCTVCKKTKSIEKDFYDKRYSWCKDCTLKYRDGKSRNKQLLKRYGITIMEYDKLLISQNNSCAICKTHVSELSKRLAVDHCHTTKKVRGLLCYNCNTGLGRFKDDTNIMSEAISYLNNSEE